MCARGSVRCLLRVLKVSYIFVLRRHGRRERECENYVGLRYILTAPERKLLCSTERFH